MEMVYGKQLGAGWGEVAELSGTAKLAECRYWVWAVHAAKTDLSGCVFHLLLARLLKDDRTLLKDQIWCHDNSDLGSTVLKTLLWVGGGCGDQPTSQQTLSLWNVIERPVKINIWYWWQKGIVHENDVIWDDGMFGLMSCTNHSWLAACEQWTT